MTALATALSRREAEFAERRRLIETRRSEIEQRLEGLLLGALAAHELVDFQLLVGTALIICGVALANLRRSSPGAAKAPGESPAEQAVA